VKTLNLEIVMTWSVYILRWTKFRGCCRG